MPAPAPESRTCRGHIRRCDKADADLPALSRMGTASCSSLCCNCSLASICICDGPLAAFHNCAVVRRSSRLLLVAASLGVALQCCCCCRAFFDMWESVTRSCKYYRLEYLLNMYIHMRYSCEEVRPSLLKIYLQIYEEDLS